jgi:hypothetical protein
MDITDWYYLFENTTYQLIDFFVNKINDESEDFLMKYYGI